MNKTTGLLLVNLGTPNSPQVRDLRPYLREFLSDPRVIDLPAIWRWLLVNLIIVPFRSPKSARLYQSIWDAKSGSPLLTHGQNLVRTVEDELIRQGTSGVKVELGMRYGQPSIASAIERLAAAGVDDVVVFPLFPQYSSAAFGSAVAKVYEVAGKLWNVPQVHVVGPYFNQSVYIEATAAIARKSIGKEAVGHVLFSYHGLPVRHCQKSVGVASVQCGSEGCCKLLAKENRNCYRAQCMETSRLLAQSLGLAADQWEVVFQSRFGRDPWIGPFLEQRIIELAQSGVSKLTVLTPSFTADCLETIEEIGVRAQESFTHHGGKELRLVPCLNADPKWTAAIVSLVRPALTAFGQC